MQVFSTQQPQFLTGNTGAMETVKRPFRHMRHPNYYLNILPELVGIALLCHAFGVLLIGLPCS